MFKYLDCKRVPGEKGHREPIMITLTTCSFCKRAKAFLAENKIEYSYIDMDTLEPEIKKQIRAEFKEKFKDTITFPALIINNTDILTGFIKPSWQLTLGLKN